MKRSSAAASRDTWLGFIGEFLIQTAKRRNDLYEYTVSGRAGKPLLPAVAKMPKRPLTAGSKRFHVSQNAARGRLGEVVARD
jgi:hypothetical protein